MGKKFRITAEDFAGNRSAAITNLLEERIILYRWTDLISEAYLNLVYPEEGGELGAIITNRRFLPTNPERLGPHVDSEGNLLFWIGIGKSPYLRKLGEHYLGGLETIKAPIAWMNVQYSDDRREWIWIDSQPVGNLESGEISLYWDRANLGLSEPYAVRIKAVDINGQSIIQTYLSPVKDLSLILYVHHKASLQ